MQLVPPNVDLRDPCLQCGHVWTWHTSESGKCQHDMIDPEFDAWIRCGCKGWRR